MWQEVWQVNNRLGSSNIEQVNLEYILRHTKQNLKHATPIETKN